MSGAYSKRDRRLQAESSCYHAKKGGERIFTEDGRVVSVVFSPEDGEHDVATSDAERNHGKAKHKSELTHSPNHVQDTKCTIDHDEDPELPLHDPVAADVELSYARDGCNYSSQGCHSLDTPTGDRIYQRR